MKRHNLVVIAVAAGGNEFKAPQDHGFMFYRSLEDLDGHVWEIMWMDHAAVMQQAEAEPMEAVAG